MAVTCTATQEANPGADPRADVDADAVETVRARGLLRHLVAGSLIVGLLVAVFLFTLALAGSTEPVLTGSVPISFAPASVVLAIVSHKDAIDGWIAAQHNLTAPAKSALTGKAA